MKRQSNILVWQDSLCQMEHLIRLEHMFRVYCLVQLERPEQREHLFWTYLLSVSMLMRLDYGKPKMKNSENKGPTFETTVLVNYRPKFRLLVIILNLCISTLIIIYP